MRSWGNALPIVAMGLAAMAAPSTAQALNIVEIIGGDEPEPTVECSAFCWGLLADPEFPAESTLHPQFATLLTPPLYDGDGSDSSPPTELERLLYLISDTALVSPAVMVAAPEVLGENTGPFDGAFDISAGFFAVKLGDSLAYLYSSEPQTVLFTANGESALSHVTELGGALVGYTTPNDAVQTVPLPASGLVLIGATALLGGLGLRRRGA